MVAGNRRGSIFAVFFNIPGIFNNNMPPYSATLPKLNSGRDSMHIECVSRVFDLTVSLWCRELCIRVQFFDRPLSMLV